MNFKIRQIVQVGRTILLLFSLAAAGEAIGAEENAAGQGTSPAHLFDSGRYEAAFTSGVLFSPFGPSRMRQP